MKVNLVKTIENTTAKVGDIIKHNKNIILIAEDMISSKYIGVYVSGKVEVSNYSFGTIKELLQYYDVGVNPDVEVIDGDKVEIRYI